MDESCLPVLPLRLSAKVLTTSMPVVLRLKDGMLVDLMFDSVRIDSLDETG